MTHRLRAADRVLAPVVLFVCFYVATFGLTWFVRFPWIQWSGLISAAVATAATMAILERGGWNLGLFVPARLAIPEFLLGSLMGAMLIAMCAILVVLSTGVRHERGNGFPWLELATTFVPAAIHEELLFRGYAFQKLRRWTRGIAIPFVALVFAGLHANNPAVGPLALGNIFLGGVLLGLAYERYFRLWFPIGLHLAWNVVSGPVLGHEVSGYVSMATVFVETGTGPAWLTGGAFGIEGSVWMTATELAGIAFLWKRLRDDEGVRS